jgi:hypothetical protein
MASSTNRINRITICIGGVKTAAHVVHPTGSKQRYDEVRTDTVDPKDIQFAPRNRFKTEEP